MARPLTITPPDPNWTRLREYINTSAVAKAFFPAAAWVLASQSVTTVEAVATALQKSGAGFSRVEVIDFFKRVGSLGFGRFMTGRRGQPTRFEWEPFTPGEIAAELAGGGEPPVAHVVAVAAPDDPEDFEHRFRLRRDREVVFVLPHNLTVAEAGRLADYIRTLPLG